MDALIALLQDKFPMIKEILQIIAYVIAAATIIVKLTPTLKDDNFLLPIVKFLSKYIALNRTVDDEAARAAIKK